MFPEMRVQPGPILHLESSRPSLLEAGKRAGGWDRRDVLEWNPSPHTDGLAEVITHILALRLRAMGIPRCFTTSKIWRWWGMTFRRLSRLMDLSRGLAKLGGVPENLSSGVWGSLS